MPPCWVRATTEDTGSVNYRFTWQLPKKRT